MRKTIRLLTTFAIMLLFTHAVHAEELPLSTYLKLYGTYIDNVFQTNLPESDYVALTYLDASYDITSGASLFYDGNYNLFSEHSSLQNHTHYLGADYEKVIFGDQGRFYLGSKVGIRQNTSDYSDYNHRSFDTYATLKYYLTDTILAKTGYEAAYGSYPNLNTFSFVENFGFIQLSKFFQTRTTLQVMLEAGRRDYPDMIEDTNGNYASQLTGSIKIAQSLGNNTGLQLRYSWHDTPHGLNEQYLNDSYYSAEEFFDDEYAYSGSEYKMVLKHLAPWRTTIKASIGLKDLSYNAPSEYTESGVREDRGVTFRFEVEKAFSLPVFTHHDVALHIQFLHKKNSSNDSYYDYSANTFSIGTKTAF